MNLNEISSYNSSQSLTKKLNLTFSKFHSYIQESNHQKNYKLNWFRNHSIWITIESPYKEYYTTKYTRNSKEKNTP
jgi:hypothetical protein